MNLPVSRLPFTQVKANHQNASNRSKPVLKVQPKPFEFSLATCKAPTLKAKMNSTRGNDENSKEKSSHKHNRTLFSKVVNGNQALPPAKRQKCEKPKPVLLTTTISSTIDKSNSPCPSSLSLSLNNTTLSINQLPVTGQRFTFLEKLGKGRFGEVWAAKENETGLMVAIKQIPKKLLEELNAEEQLRNEIDVQSNMRHVHILRVFACFHDDNFIYVVLEYCALGDLYHRILEQKQLSHSETASHIRSLIHGLQYLHGKHVIHRDLKPENLLLDSRGKLKIADFGSCSHTMHFRSKRFCGTLDYLAPEIVRREIYDEKIDHWAVGILCYEMLVGHPPFQEPGFTATTSNIVCLNYEFPSDFCPLAQDFISKILVLDPKSRLSLEQMLEHPWLKQNLSSEATVLSKLQIQ